MIDNLSTAIHAFSMRTLTSLSEDKILLPRDAKWSNFSCENGQENMYYFVNLFIIIIYSMRVFHITFS